MSYRLQMRDDVINNWQKDREILCEKIDNCVNVNKHELVAIRVVGGGKRWVQSYITSIDLSLIICHNTGADKLKWAIENNYPINNNTLVSAVKSNNINTLKVLKSYFSTRNYDFGKDISENVINAKYLLDVGIEENHYEAIKWIIENYYVSRTHRLLSSNIQILIYLKNNGFELCSNNYITAIKDKNLDTIKYLYDQKVPYYTKTISKHLIQESDTIITKWWLDKGLFFDSEYCRNADNIDIIKYFINIGIKPNDDTWKSCCKNLENMKWLKNNNYKLSDDMYTILYSESENPEIKDWLFNKFDKIKLEFEPIVYKLQSGIIENIMTAIYDTTKDYKYRLLNTKIYNETKLSFYNTFSNESPFQKEVIEYIKVCPKKVGFLSFYYDEIFNICNPKGIFNILTFSPEINKYNRLQKILDAIVNLVNKKLVVKNEIIKEKEYSLLEVIKSVETGIIDNFDILTRYNIYKNRINCVKVNNNYAKERILKALEDYKTSQTESFLHMYCYHQYLILNCYMFDIIDHPEYTYVLPELNFEYLDPERYDNHNYGSMLTFFMKIFDNQPDVLLFNKQKLIMKEEIDRLELLVKNYIIYELI